MTDSSTQAIKTVLHPVSDPAAAKAVYAALLGVPPQHDSDYYVGFDVAGQHIGLVPGGGAAGDDLAGGLLARAGHRGEARRGDRRGSSVKDPVRDVGSGRLVATVSDPDGNLLGLLQDRKEARNG